MLDHVSADGSEFAEPGSSQDSLGTTLDLPGLDVSDPDPENDLDDENQRDSQVGGWWGKAYQVLNKLQKLHTKQVPLPVLYEMHVSGEPMEEYFGTFEADDLKPPSCISSVNVLYKISFDEITRFPSFSMSQTFCVYKDFGLFVFFGGYTTQCTKQHVLTHSARHPGFAHYLQHCIREFGDHGTCEATCKLGTFDDWVGYRSLNFPEA